AALRLRRIVTTAGKKFVENASGAAAENIAENFKRVVKSTTSPSAACARARIERSVAVAVVGRALLVVAQNLVSFAKLLELFLGGVVAGIFVRMIFEREFAVGFFDFFRIRFAPDA